MLASAHPNYGFYVLAAVHGVVAVLAFGGIAFAGVYGTIASRPRRPGALEEASRWFGKPNRSVYLLPAVPVLGFAALAAEGDSGRMGQAWVVAALLIWLAVGALAVYVVAPAEREIRRLLATAGDPGGISADNPGEISAGDPGETSAGDPDALSAGALDAVAAAGKRLSVVAGVCDVAFFVSLCLMIWEPH